MTKPALNKTSLKNQRDNLNLYGQYLPSLDLKRQQFLAELKKAKDRYAKTTAEIEELEKKAEQWVVFLADPQISTQGIATLKNVALGEENLLGVKLPVLHDVEIETAPYSFIMAPLWFDAFVKTLREAITLRIRNQVESRRMTLLEEALQVITQRVNLFDKVLIPSAEKNIRLIRIALSDMERAGVVRSKLAKSKRLKLAAGMKEQGG